MTTQKDYLSCAETAKLVRGALKKAFPGVKFSVRSHTYAGGASIDVRWTDGPQVDVVDAVISQYKGADFDGMIDLKTYNSDWLYPDGHAESAQSQIGHSYGSHTYDAEGDEVPAEWANDYMAGVFTEAAGETTRVHDPSSVAFELGKVDGAARKKAGARLVHFGADFIFTERDFSPGYRTYLEDAVVLLSWSDGPFEPNKRYEFGIIPEGEMSGRAYCDYGSTLVWQLSRTDPDRLASALQATAKDRVAARVREVNKAAHEAAAAAGDGGPAGFYVTVKDGNAWGALLGPYAAKADAEADVPLGKALAESVNDRAIWYAYGVTKVTMRHGADLPAGRLDHLALIPRRDEPQLVAAYRHRVPQEVK